MRYNLRHRLFDWLRLRLPLVHPGVFTMPRPDDGVLCYWASPTRLGIVVGWALGIRPTRPKWSVLP